MFFHRSLVKAIIFYIAIILILNFSFGFIYWSISSDVEIKSIIKWFYFSTNGTGGVKPQEAMWIWMCFHYLFTSLVISISTGVIFYFILKRPPKIIFPDKLILRKRLKKNEIALTIKLGNRGKKKLYEVNIRLFYIYFVNRHDGALVRDATTHFVDSVPYIEKVYRFSFDVAKFPENFFNSILQEDGINKNNKISILIYGKYGRFGDDFMLEKDYFISDIAIAKDTALIYEYLPDSENLVKTKENWENFNKIIEFTNDELEGFIEELKSIKNNLSS